MKDLSQWLTKYRVKQNDEIVDILKYFMQKRNFQQTCHDVLFNYRKCISCFDIVLIICIK